MSSNTPLPPGLEGQQEKPSRLDLLWFQYRNYVYAAIGFAALAIAVSYWFEYQRLAARDATWSEFAETVKLDEGYSTETPLWGAYGNDPRGQSFALRLARGGLISDLGKEIEELSTSDLDNAIAKAGADRKPWLLFVKARAAAERQDWTGALATLDKLAKDYPNHPLNKSTGHPIQLQEEVEPEDGEEEPAPSKKPELEPALKGSPVGLMREQVVAEQAFHAEHPEFYTPREPTSEDTLVFKFADYGEVKVKLFDQVTPAHAARLRELVGEGFWNGMRVHQLSRTPDQQSFVPQKKGEFQVGLASTREDDRTKWKSTEEPDEKNQVEWESDGLSHFPGTLAVLPAKEGKSQVETLVFCSEDMAAQADGTRVIVGRVVEGLDVVRDIVESPFSQETEAERGQGRPESNITVESVTIQ